MTVGIYHGRLVGASYHNAGPDGRPTAIDLTSDLPDPTLALFNQTVDQIYGPAPLPNIDRLRNYKKQTGGKLTPHQQRRAEKKARRKTKRTA